MKSLSRIAALAAAVVGLVSLVNCAAPGGEEVGTSEEAMMKSGNPDPGGSSSGGGGGVVISCNTSTQCCVSGGQTLAQIDAELGSSTCGSDLAAMGCGAFVKTGIGLNVFSTFESGYATVSEPIDAMDGSGAYWYEITCPQAPSLGGKGVHTNVVPFLNGLVPTSCIGPGFNLQAQGKCSTAAPSGYYAFDLDPIGCSGGSCPIARGTSSY